MTEQTKAPEEDPIASNLPVQPAPVDYVGAANPVKLEDPFGQAAEDVNVDLEVEPLTSEEDVPADQLGVMSNRMHRLTGLADAYASEFLKVRDDNRVSKGSKMLLCAMANSLGCLLRVDIQYKPFELADVTPIIDGFDLEWFVPAKGKFIVPSTALILDADSGEVIRTWASEQFEIRTQADLDLAIKYAKLNDALIKAAKESIEKEMVEIEGKLLRIPQYLALMEMKAKLIEQEDKMIAKPKASLEYWTRTILAQGLAVAKGLVKKSKTYNSPFGAFSWRTSSAKPNIVNPEAVGAVLDELGHGDLLQEGISEEMREDELIRIMKDAGFGAYVVKRPAVDVSDRLLILHDEYLRTAQELKDGKELDQAASIRFAFICNLFEGDPGESPAVTITPETDKASLKL